ncbi:cysteine desulfurase family protein [Patescibacteria group bacterium]
MKKIYLDNASTTHTSKEVVLAMKPYFEKIYGNPSSLHQEGRKARYAVDKARKNIAKVLNCQSSEIIFTGSGTESCNLAVFGTSFLKQRKGVHIITSQIEHHAVLRPCEKLEKQGFSVTYLPVSKEGIINVSDFKKAITPETFFVSIMYVNNEIGTIQQISEIGKIAKKENQKREKTKLPKILFHTDACQAAGYLDLDVQKLGVDLLTINGSKIYGPKGTGLLFVKEGVKLDPQMIGGGQEMGLRAGTENLAGIIGLAKALEISQKTRNKESQRLEPLRNYFISQIEKRIPKVSLNGSLEKRIPNNVNISILDIEGEAMLLWLDKYGICATTGSACDSQSLEPSHVILALKKPYEFAHGSIRFSLGRKTTKKEIDYVLEILPKIVTKLRNISPIRVKL